MIEQAESRETAARRGGPPKIWICAYQHRHGVDAWACATEELAHRAFAETCREFWEEARAVDVTLVHDEHQRRLPAAPPGDDRLVVELYFETMAQAPWPEFFFIEEQELIDGREEASR
jgi:hypothetical protein